jgi:DNA-binding transcriptional MerR regulator
MKSVIRATGLAADRLRIWEKRYGVIQPSRNSAGRRVYSDADLQKLKILAQLVNSGHSISSVAALSTRELSALSAKGAPLSGHESYQKEVEEILQAIGEFRLDSLKVGLAKVKHLLSPRDYAFQLVPTLMCEVGLAIDSGKLSISQEHALSDLIRHDLRQIYEDLEPLGRKATPLVFAAPEGHHHDFGLLMAAIRCRFMGFQTNFLGANLPAESLVEAVKGFRAQAILLAVSPVPEDEEKVEINQYIKTLDKNLPTKVSLWTGGAGAYRVKRKGFVRDLWVFESLAELEKKLEQTLVTQ